MNLKIRNLNNDETGLLKDFLFEAIFIIGTAMMRKMLELLKLQGYERASLAVQKANFAVKMYKNVGFKTVDENAEEYIMVCEL